LDWHRISVIAADLPIQHHRYAMNNQAQPASPNSSQQLPCVLACSGCSHAGELADHTARRLNQTGVAKMSCLAGVGGRVKSITTTVQKAPELLMIDGCPLECGANSLRLAGITEFKHLKLHELDVRKHTTEVSETTVQRLAEAAQQLLAKTPAPVSA
jgi:uncharacterized metal-binding protein